jgi:hypothetical protein
MSVENLKLGQSMLTSVRKINKVASDPSQGSILQIELAEPKKGNSMLALFLPNDPRIVKSKAQRAWSGIEPEMFQKFFGVSDEVMARINALPVSTGVQNLQEGVHKISLNILNPKVNGNQLHVHLVESVVKPNDQATPKINPATKAVITCKGLPVYRTTSIVDTEVADVTLVSDKIVEIAQVAEVAPAVMRPNPAVAQAMTAAGS